MRTPILAALLLALSLLPHSSLACSTFLLDTEDGTYFGRNYDFEHGSGLLLVNNRGLAKTADRGDSAATWTSRYGSVTFNQFGRDFPMGGMNEAGLVVELMWLDSSTYPAVDSRKEVGVLEWIQYQLDVSGNVEELLVNAEVVRITGRTPIHYLVADSSGDAATIEFLDGKLVVHRGETLPVPALTNSTYARSIGALPSTGQGGEWKRAHWTDNSIGRFARAARRLEDYRGSAPIEFAFETLAEIAQRSTRWSVVYDLGERRIEFRTDKNESRRSVSLGDLEFSCSMEVLAIDLNGRGEGDLKFDLAPLEEPENLKFIRTSYRKTSFMKRTEDAVAIRVSKLAYGAQCAR